MTIMDISVSGAGHEYRIAAVKGNDNGQDVVQTNPVLTYYTLSQADYNALCIPVRNHAPVLPYDVPDALIEDAAERFAAIRYALYLLGFGDKSIKALRKKLTEKGHSKQAVEGAIALLQKNGILDDVSLCARKLSGYALRKHYGPARIKSALFEKGFSRETIDNAFQACEIDFDEQLRYLAQAFIGETVPADFKQKQKLVQKLVRFGYSYSDVANCLETVSKEE